MPVGDDKYMAQVRKRVDPAFGAYAITKSDANTLNPATRAIYVGGAGNLVVDMLNGENDISFVGVLAGTILPICVSKVKSTTTATNLIGLY